jgi:hypothetical protein
LWVFKWSKKKIEKIEFLKFFLVLSVSYRNSLIRNVGRATWNPEWSPR